MRCQILPVGTDAECEGGMLIGCRHKVVGHNCRFMRGPGTDSGELQRLRTAISQQRPVTVSPGLPTAELAPAHGPSISLSFLFLHGLVKRI